MRSPQPETMKNLPFWQCSDQVLGYIPEAGSLSDWYIFWQGYAIIQDFINQLKMISSVF